LELVCCRSASSIDNPYQFERLQAKQPWGTFDLHFRQPCQPIGKSWPMFSTSLPTKLARFRTGKVEPAALRPSERRPRAIKEKRTLDSETAPKCTGPEQVVTRVLVCSVASQFRIDKSNCRSYRGIATRIGTAPRHQQCRVSNLRTLSVPQLRIDIPFVGNGRYLLFPK
jgi:hypothetical protein